MGKVYLVGAGPGDPKLITLRGLKLIKGADTIIYDYLINKDLLGFAGNDAELIYVGKQASCHEMPQADINALLVKKAKEKGLVVRLKGGDPFMFGRGGEEAEFLAEHRVDFEIVPGVTSAISAPAYAGIPLTHREYASSVAFITGHEDASKTESTIRWDALAHGCDTLVFLMGIKNLKDIKRNLIKAGKDPCTPACVIQWGTLPEQKVVSGNLKEIDVLAKAEGIKPPGVIVVGNVAGLRERLKWFEKKPLFGKKIAVTRPPRQSTKFGSVLMEKGARVIYIPTIEIEPIDPNKALLKSFKRIRSYYCIIFTSVNGASIFFDNLFKIGMDARDLYGIKVLPIGEATASFLKSVGIVPDLVPEQFTSEGIVHVLKDLDIKDNVFLLPRAKDARDVIVDYIKNQGGKCDVVPLYKASLPETPALLTEKPDIITFTSSSTVSNFLKIYGRKALNNTLIASIGPITTETLRKNNIEVHIESGKHDTNGLAEAIEQYITK
ncbi:MAG: uroporphyrinogen-III C-methyltransferase [Proteobacteria bacterium]|nr:uroporphyrinogen-III C-methyltransferase [Pseudomonadota bacterium]